MNLAVLSSMSKRRNTAQFIDDGLVMWLDARDSSTMTLTGSRLDEWRCKHGTGNKVATSSGGVAFNPSYNSALFGGLGGINFASKVLESPTGFPLNWTTGFTIIAVVRKTSRNGYFLASNSSPAAGVLGVSMCERLGANTGGYAAQGVPRNIAYVGGHRANNVAAIGRTILNGQLYAVASGSYGQSTGNFAKFGLGGLIGSALYFIGEMATICVYNRLLSDGEVAQQSEWLMEQYAVTPLAAPTWSIVIDGNSLAAGYNGTNAATCYDGALAANGSPLATDIYISAISGSTTTSLTSSAPTRVDPFYTTSVDAKRRIVIIWEIGNDIGLNASRTDVQAYNNIKAYAQARKAIGWKVIVMTALPRTSSSNVNYETYRLSCNAMIRANAISEGWADAIADVGGDATIGETGDSANGTYYNDGLHLRDAGHNIAKTYVTAAINAVTA